MIEDNGILASVPGEYIAGAWRGLPPASTAEDRLYEVEIEAGHLGKVRLFLRRHRARHHKHSHWFWVACRAEAIATPDVPREAR